MASHRIKVAPITTKAKTANKDYICFCQTIWPIIMFVKVLGVLPITAKHEKNKCVFMRSWPWTFHSGFVCCIYVYQIVWKVHYAELLETKSLIILLNKISNGVYAYYIVFILLATFVNLPKHIRSMNKFALTFKFEVFCQSAKRVALFTQYGVIFTYVFLAASQALVYLWLNNSENYQTSFSISDFFYRFSQTLSLSFYAAYFGVVTIVIGGFACFEKLLISSLKYVPVHPINGIDETNNERDFLGIIHFQLCKGEHPALEEFSGMSAAEVVEHLRIYHEDLCLCVYSWNDSMDPLFLVNTVVELGILIIHWYAVVAHLVYTFKHPKAATIHVLNCMFVVVHTYGLYLFLKNAQNMKNMVQGLTNFLLEYSTRITSLDEHQSVRLFIEKLKNHRPFTASGVFTIDLGVAGSISANILTYVLVALQFEISEE